MHAGLQDEHGDKATAAGRLDLDHDGLDGGYHLLHLLGWGQGGHLGEDWIDVINLRSWRKKRVLQYMYSQFCLSGHLSIATISP